MPDTVSLEEYMRLINEMQDGELEQMAAEEFLAQAVANGPRAEKLWREAGCPDGVRRLDPRLRECEVCGLISSGDGPDGLCFATEREALAYLVSSDSDFFRTG